MSKAGKRLAGLHEQQAGDREAEVASAAIGAGRHAAERTGRATRWRAWSAMVTPLVFAIASIRLRQLRERGKESAVQVRLQEGQATLLVEHLGGASLLRRARR